MSQALATHKEAPGGWGTGGSSNSRHAVGNVRQTSRRNARDELVEDLDHLGTRPRAVRRFRDVQGGLVTGTHEYVRERPGRLRADAPHVDPALHDCLHQAEDVPLAHLPPVRPAQNRRPVDKGDAVNLRLDADVQPAPHGLPQRLDRIRDPGCGHFVGEPHGNIGLDCFQNRVVLSANWWYRAPRVTPAAATIASAGTSAKPCPANSRRAAATSASRVAAERSAWVRRARGVAEVRVGMLRFSTSPPGLVI